MAKPKDKNQTLQILVDSDAFVALVKQNDTNHVRALDLLSQLSKLQVHFITSNYVFAESVTVISQRISHKTALAFIKNVRSPKSMVAIKWVDEAIEALALDIFKKQISKNVSFVDCTNMALVNHYELDGIFSFDRVYTKQGFTLAGNYIS